MNGYDSRMSGFYFADQRAGIEGLEVEHLMKKRDFNIISRHAHPGQVDAIVRRRTAGHVGTIGMSGDVSNRVPDLDGNVRFKLFRDLLRTIRNFGS